MLFSERHKYKSVREIFQKQEMDESLRNGIWNVFDLCLWQKYHTTDNWRHSIKSSNIGFLLTLYWHDFFKQTIDSMPDNFRTCLDQIRNKFFSFEWHEVYSFTEFTLIHFPIQLNKKNFLELCNRILEREISAYRIINDQVTEITSEQEIQSIEEATKASNKYSGVQLHLQTALTLMSDRQNPDYRNSIKESISAVEALCKILTGENTTTLGKALKLLEDQYDLHPALKSSFSSLYGYTSDADGIRHAMLEESNLSFTDAKFILVSCTNFINYLIEKIKY